MNPPKEITSRIDLTTPLTDSFSNVVKTQVLVLNTANTQQLHSSYETFLDSSESGILEDPAPAPFSEKIEATATLINPARTNMREEAVDTAEKTLGCACRLFNKIGSTFAYFGIGGIAGVGAGFGFAALKFGFAAALAAVGSATLPYIIGGAVAGLAITAAIMLVAKAVKSCCACYKARNNAPINQQPPAPPAQPDEVPAAPAEPGRVPSAGFAPVGNDHTQVEMGGNGTWEISQGGTVRTDVAATQQD